MKKPTVRDLLAHALQIEQEKPVYKLGGDGSQGACDCIGLIIGALRRCGVKWNGIHGSNWAARNECVRLRPIADAPVVGDLVLKSRKPGDRGYSLPVRYNVSSDKLDYYHAGLVLQTSPLVILHCSSSGVMRDSKRGQWAWVAELNMVDYGGAEQETASAAKQSTVQTSASEPLLREGAKGEAVVTMQQLLLRHGIMLPRFGADGKFGKETLSALKSFQRTHDLKADGICGAKTWHALKGGTP